MQRLTQRQLRVVLTGKSSSWAEVLSGVPQGSVLNFLIFINDLDQAAQQIERLKNFPDDTKMGQGVSNAEYVERQTAAGDKWDAGMGRDLGHGVQYCKMLSYAPGTRKQ
jgi:hypothetical protein